MILGILLPHGKNAEPIQEHMGQDGGENGFGAGVDPCKHHTHGDVLQETNDQIFDGQLAEQGCKGQQGIQNYGNRIGKGQVFLHQRAEYQPPVKQLLPDRYEKYDGSGGQQRIFSQLGHQDILLQHIVKMGAEVIVEKPFGQVKIQQVVGQEIRQPRKECAKTGLPENLAQGGVGDTPGTYKKCSENQNRRQKIDPMKGKFRQRGASQGVQKGGCHQQCKPPKAEARFILFHSDIKKLIGKHTLPHTGNAHGIDKAMNENGRENGTTAFIGPGEAQSCR